MSLHKPRKLYESTGVSEKTFISVYIRGELASSRSLRFFYYFERIKVLRIPQHSSLKKKILINVLLNVSVGTYKGVRHMHGLPVRGQRTWSNGKTSYLISNNLKVYNNFLKSRISS